MRKLVKDIEKKINLQLIGFYYVREFFYKMQKIVTR